MHNLELFWRRKSRRKRKKLRLKLNSEENKKGYRRKQKENGDKKKKQQNDERKLKKRPPKMLEVSGRLVKVLKTSTKKRRPYVIEGFKVVKFRPINVLPVLDDMRMMSMKMVLYNL